MMQQCTIPLINRKLKKMILIMCNYKPICNVSTAVCMHKFSITSDTLNTNLVKNIIV